jgi:SHS2 domain-containing protein
MSKRNNQNSQVGELLRRKNMKVEKCKETESVLMQWSQQKLYLHTTDVFLKKNAMFLFMNISKSQKKVRFTMWFHGKRKSLNGKFI